MPTQGEFEPLVFFIALVFFMLAGAAWEYVRLFRAWGRTKLNRLRPSSFGNACLVGMPRSGGMWVGLVLAQYFGAIFLLITVFFSFVWPSLTRVKSDSGSFGTPDHVKENNPAGAQGVSGDAEAVGSQTPKGRAELIGEFLRDRVNVRPGEEGRSFRSDLGMQRGSLFILLDELGEDFDLNISADDADSVDSIDDVLELASRL
ncbi:MAG: hypothetical protein ACSHYB_03810 [Roseibacillus sp.]